MSVMQLPTFRPLRLLLLTLFTVAFSANGVAAQSTALLHNPTVRVTGGEIRGLVHEGVASFKGVPFAAPPVGGFRWKAPQPVVPWSGVREADQYGPAPMQ